MPYNVVHVEVIFSSFSQRSNVWCWTISFFLGFHIYLSRPLGPFYQDWSNFGAFWRWHCMVNLLTVYIGDDSIQLAHGVGVLLESQAFLRRCREQSIQSLYGLSEQCEEHLTVNPRERGGRERKILLAGVQKKVREILGWNNLILWSLPVKCSLRNACQLFKEECWKTTSKKEQLGFLRSAFLPSFQGEISSGIKLVCSLYGAVSCTLGAEGDCKYLHIRYSNIRCKKNCNVSFVDKQELLAIF